MSTISPYLITLFTLSEISGYTLLGPKLYSQSLPSNNRGWSNLVPYPFRTYQPSVPFQYYGRYVGDPYFSPNMQNPDYYFSQDNYPYSSSFDDPDYYSNILYYIPSNRRIPYYDQPVIDPIDEIQDYDEEAPPEEDNIVSKTQRDWWLEKNVLPNEDTDFTDFNTIIEEIPQSLASISSKDAKVPKKAKSKTKEAKKKPKNRFNGIDGFGRKKDKEQVYGTYKTNPRRDDERTWVYGVPVRSDFNEDEDVRELRSLLKESPPQRGGGGGAEPMTMRNNLNDYDNSDLANWIVGNKKRNGIQSTPHRGAMMKENTSSKITSTLNPLMFQLYNEAGIENIPVDYIPSERWPQPELTQPEEPSVFDKIKRLLALEDKVNQQIKSKRSQDCDSGICQYRTEKESRVELPSSTTTTTTQTTTMKQFPDVTRGKSKSPSSSSSTKKPELIRNHNKRSTADKKNVVSDEESLVRQLNSLRHIRN